MFSKPTFCYQKLSLKKVINNYANIFAAHLSNITFVLLKFTQAEAFEENHCPKKNVSRFCSKQT